jgi:type IV pilus assembly protein PilA
MNIRHLLRTGKGFTLIELLVVVVIIGILAAVALPNLIGQTDKARLTEATATLSGINTGQEAFFFENKTYNTIGTLGSVPTVSQTTNATLADGAVTVTTAGAQSTFNADLGVDITQVSARWDFATAKVITGSFSATSPGWNAAAGGKTAIADSKGLAAYILKGVNKTFTDAVK